MLGVVYGILVHERKLSASCGVGTQATGSRRHDHSGKRPCRGVAQRRSGALLRCCRRADARDAQPSAFCTAPRHASCACRDHRLLDRQRFRCSCGEDRCLFARRIADARKTDAGQPSHVIRPALDPAASFGGQGCRCTVAGCCLWRPAKGKSHRSRFGLVWDGVASKPALHPSPQRKQGNAVGVTGWDADSLAGASGLHGKGNGAKSLMEHGFSRLIRQSDDCRQKGCWVIQSDDRE